MLRIIVSPTRSGSSALLRCFENNPSVHRVYHQPVKSGFRESGTFDYEFFDLDEASSSHTIVGKETIGGFDEPETDFSPLPRSPSPSPTLGRWPVPAEAIARVKPLVLVREPLQTWASIERLNVYSAGISPYRSPFSYFVESYRNVSAFLASSRGGDQDLPVYAVTQEMLGAAPVRTLRLICERWAIPWAASMVDWTLPYGAKTWFSTETTHRMETDPRFRRSKESLAASRRYRYSPPASDVVEPAHEAVIREQLSPLYERAVAIAQSDFG